MNNRSISLCHNVFRTTYTISKGVSTSAAYENYKPPVKDPRKMRDEYFYWLRRPYDLTFKGLKKSFENYRINLLKKNQHFTSKRSEVLGSELGALSFIVYRGGKVKIQGHEKWITEEDRRSLPLKKEDNLLVEAIDLGDLQLLYDGCKNIENLQNLKFLRIYDSQTVDDFVFDKLVSMYQTLENLEIINCKKITSNGLESIAKLRNLKTLKLEGCQKFANLQLICLILEDSIEGLKIEIVDETPQIPSNNSGIREAESSINTN